MLLSSIINFFTDTTFTMKKSDAYKYLEFTINSIKDDIIPTLNNIKDSKNLKQLKNNHFFTYIYKQSGISAKDNYQAIERYVEFFTKIEKSYSVLKKLIDNHMQEVMTNKSMSVKSAAILRVLTDISSLTMYMPDLCIFVLTDEKDSDLPKITFKRVKENFANFIEIIKTYYKTYDKTLKDIEYLPDDNITPDDAEKNLIQAMLGRYGADLPSSKGFIGNPIYHIRLWWVDRQIAAYENLKQKKQLLELKVMELKLREQNENDPALRKQIEYYEDKISKMEYALVKLAE